MSLINYDHLSLNTANKYVPVNNDDRADHLINAKKNVWVEIINVNRHLNCCIIIYWLNAQPCCFQSKCCWWLIIETRVWLWCMPQHIKFLIFQFWKIFQRDIIAYFSTFRVETFLVLNSKFTKMCRSQKTETRLRNRGCHP